MGKYLKEGKDSMSWRGVYHFMEKMGVGCEKERLKRQKANAGPYEESGIEISDFVLNQLRRVLGNKKPRRRRRRRLALGLVRQGSNAQRTPDSRREGGALSRQGSRPWERKDSKGA